MTPNTDPEKDIAASIPVREAFYDDIGAGRLSLSEATRQMRKIVGMTQTEYARLLGIAPRVLMEIERGKGNPRLDTLEKLARPFGLSVGFTYPHTKPDHLPSD